MRELPSIHGTVDQGPDPSFSPKEAHMSQSKTVTGPELRNTDTSGRLV